MSHSLWLQIGTVLVSPVLALAGVGVGARLTLSGEERHWLRDARLRAYSAYLLACDTYDVASRQLRESLRAGQHADQVSARDDALRAIKDVITCREGVLLLGSQKVQAACVDTTAAVFARNESTRRLLTGGAQEGAAEDGDTLDGSIETFRKTVQSELLPGRFLGRRAVR